MNILLSATAVFTVCVFTSGLTFACFTWTFSPLQREPRHPTSLGTNIGIRSGTGFLATVTLVLIATSSVKAAGIVAAVYSFFLFLSFVWHHKHGKKRRSLINRELPLLLDHLVLQIESGHSIQEVLRSSTGLFLKNGPLYAGLCEFDQTIMVGQSLNEALRVFREKLKTPEADMMLATISQAVQHGTPLGKVLREQSKRMRESLVLEGEQFANTLSVKILIPLLFFVFPASFLVIFSPVIVSLSGGFR